jgi:serine/threonine protein kinase
MLGRYQVLKPLAKGGMAEVLLARAIGLGGFARHVVIKRIRVEHGSDQKSINMFLDEARLCAALHHANIVQVHDVGEEGGKYFFVMEYVHGRDARELLRHNKEHKQQIPIEHVIAIVTAAAAGLHYAHEQRGPDRKPLNIVHRDISPGNILLGFDGGVKVADFGIAKTEGRFAEETQAGETKGKVGYMSPEQCRSQPIDRRTDVYLLGVVLYELLTVRRLFKSDSRFETMSAIVDGKIALPSTIRTDLPQDLEQIVMRALANQPDDRYQTADELRLVLEAFARASGLSISPGHLSDYLKDQFGDVPEPWLVGEEVPPPPAEVLERLRTSSQLIPFAPESQPEAPSVETTPPPDTDVDAQPLPSEPEVNVRAVTSTQPELEALKAAKPIIEGEPAGPEEPEPETPMAWQRPMAPSSRSRAVWFVLAILALVGAGAFVVITFVLPELEDKPAAVAAPPAPADPAAVVEATPDAAPVAISEDAAIAAAPTAGTEPLARAAAPSADAGVIDAGSAVAVLDAGAPAVVPAVAVPPRRPSRKPPRKKRPRPAPPPPAALAPAEPAASESETSEAGSGSATPDN